MAVPGRAPLDEKIGRTPNAEWLDVFDIPFAGERPELPVSRMYLTAEGVPLELELSEQTRAWWVIVSTMPHCILWTPADWQFAVDLALLKDGFYYSPGANVSAAVEIRRREDQLGTTVEARRKLRIRYLEAPATAAPSERLERRTVKELRELAKDRGLEVRASMRKPDLLELLDAAAAPTNVTRLDERRRRLIDADAP